MLDLLFLLSFAVVGLTLNPSFLKREFGFQQLLTGNSKLNKRTQNFKAKGLSFAPYNMSGRNVCPMAGFCAQVCVLWFAGRTVMESVRLAAIARTKLFFEDRATFMELLFMAVAKFRRECLADGFRAFVRLNAAADLAWEKLCPELFTTFHDVTFYDYTKVYNRALAYASGHFPSNYHLTFSASERSTDEQLRTLLELGANVSIVSDSAWNPQKGIIGRIPQTIAIDGKRFRVVDGDKHDFRVPDTDGTGVVVMLRAKGGIVAAIQSVLAGFARRVRGGRFSTHELYDITG